MTPKRKSDQPLGSENNVPKVKKKINIDHVAVFKGKIQGGPCFICVVCNRCLYKRTVVKFKEKKYQLDDLESELNTKVKSFDGKIYICRTCDKNLKKNKIPCQAVVNKLHIMNLPNEFSNLRKLEKVLIAKRLLFKKISIMPKGQFPKLKGAICNVPVENVDISKFLPRRADSNGLVIVKLKRKLEYKGHVYFEPVRPGIIIGVLQYLKINNHLYSDIEIVPSNIPRSLNIENEEEQIVDDDQVCSNIETEENELDQYRIASNETSLISNVPEPNDQESVISVAPGEGKLPLYKDLHCEEFLIHTCFQQASLAIK